MRLSRTPRRRVSSRGLGRALTVSPSAVRPSRRTQVESLRAELLSQTVRVGMHHSAGEHTSLTFDGRQTMEGVEFTKYALVRMRERRIAKDQTLQVLEFGERLRTRPCSVWRVSDHLTSKDRRLAALRDICVVVAAQDRDGSRLTVVTAFRHRSVGLPDHLSAARV